MFQLGCYTIPLPHYNNGAMQNQFVIHKVLDVLLICIETWIHSVFDWVSMLILSLIMVISTSWKRVANTLVCVCKCFYDPNHPKFHFYWSRYNVFHPSTTFPKGGMCYTIFSHTMAKGLSLSHHCSFVDFLKHFSDIFDT